ncbi:putative short-subunit dehydrogenase-like oxidoreductase (DUF2520 family) [Microbacterium natoriense]|uniref:Short-subunit dehydrogenase-like oxidoreductase (DUF2520 family) n=1 Tax=Microbacterium natoriense TaxID=284570 RepID=A0AAW8ET11_9MICO|nr:DUF2520 domain-containing protein [Microbacterium natoriense]MDQ0646570.1 putative short-subunit dehydrogenase-like oxidoreductase (DUF2520 family) [Microbacterium natoriense]
MNPASALAPATIIAVIGAGRLGGVLSRALRTAGFSVLGPLRRDQSMPSADIALLCVPDAAIPAVAFVARSHVRLVAHVSGATGLDDVDVSIHPLQTFTGAETPDVFHGIGAAIDGRTDGDRELAAELARALGMNPFTVTDRVAYHAAASFASNFVLTVLDAAEQLATAAGVENPREILAPLVRQSVDNWQSQGAKAALTGPIARGDEQTVARQREAAPDRTLFDALAAATRALKDRA